MYFTDAHDELRLHIRKFLTTEVQPHLEEWEEQTFPDSIFKRFGELGFLGLRYPPEYGGQGGDYFSAVVDDKGLLKKDLADDGLHPNAAGFKIMAPLAEAAIEKALK